MQTRLSNQQDVCGLCLIPNFPVCQWETCRTPLQGSLPFNLVTAAEREVRGKQANAKILLFLPNHAVTQKKRVPCLLSAQPGQRSGGRGLSYQSSGNLAASDGQHLRDHREEKTKSQLGTRVWMLGRCTSTRTPPSSPLSILKHILQTGRFIMLKMNFLNRIHPNSAVCEPLDFFLHRGAVSLTSAGSTAPQ